MKTRPRCSQEHVSCLFWFFQVERLLLKTSPFHWEGASQVILFNILLRFEAPLVTFLEKGGNIRMKPLCWRPCTSVFRRDSVHPRISPVRSVSSRLLPRISHPTGGELLSRSRPSFHPFPKCHPHFPERPVLTVLLLSVCEAIPVLTTQYIRSRNRPLGHSPPTSFWWSSGIQPMIEEGNRSRSAEKTPRYGQQTMREGMHRLQERPATDRFSHELSAGWTSSTSWTLA